MNKYTTILLDLDGTISDPEIGITQSIQYALRKMGREESDIEKLRSFIGPPLHVSFAEHYNFDQEDVAKAIEFYRERFIEKGMFENELYSDMPDLLKALKEQAMTLVVATSKPTVFAKEILQYFKINHFFEHIVGSNLDGTRTSKTEIIQYILGQYKTRELKEFIMIGDREYDLIGANNIGVDAIGVSYGFGSYDELNAYHPKYIVDSVKQLKNILIGVKSK